MGRQHYPHFADLVYVAWHFHNHRTQQPGEFCLVLFKTPYGYYYPEMDPLIVANP